MRLFRWTMMLVLFAILAMAVQQTLVVVGVWGGAGEAQVLAVDDDDQEIALIEPATNIEDWGRLVTAIKLLEADWRRINPTLAALKVSPLENAFPSFTSQVSEISLYFDDAPKQKLRVRWYKISGEHDAASWVRKLRARARQPLAVIGGGTSDRAVRLARALQQTYPPGEPAPTLLITTATAENTGKGNPLIELYAGRTFRYSFTNQKMVASLLQFATQHPNLWPYKPADLDLPAAAAAGVVSVHFQPYTMHTIKWLDERYSQDMCEHFEKEFKTRFPVGRFFHQGDIHAGVGEFFQPAPQEQVMVDTFLSHESPIGPKSFLALPTTTVRMRRFLIHLRERSPQDARNLVILNGDAIPFHAVYRDRDVIWNILALPYSLLFFSHRDPIDQSAGFDWTREERPESATEFPPRTTTGTHDVLLYRDVIESLVYAAFEPGRLLSDAKLVRERLHETCWYVPPADKAKADRARVCHPRLHGDQPRMLFDAAGNRHRHTGEHIIWVRPNFTDDLVDLTSTISVWTVRREGPVRTWYEVESRPVRYNQAR